MKSHGQQDSRSSRKADLFTLANGDIVYEYSLIVYSCCVNFADPVMLLLMTIDLDSLTLI